MVFKCYISMAVRSLRWFWLDFSLVKKIDILIHRVKNTHQNIPKINQQNICCNHYWLKIESSSGLEILQRSKSSMEILLNWIAFNQSFKISIWGLRQSNFNFKSYLLIFSMFEEIKVQNLYCFDHLIIVIFYIHDQSFRELRNIVMLIHRVKN